ncbi:MAG TPA: hypothetical protein DIT13_13345 [Verrucomicrobiales bacterium]|nr:hypothetical protein [Verrucomicrobiales bacterium]HRJ08879.1 DUF2172 domain-containing protein [Prosthecobacter sp.]HRK15167.1 DUF2172 domain-containing protein [Prosthecobacter sp.]
MSAQVHHYTQADLVAALRGAGARAGDVVFVHASLGRLGYPERGRSMADACATALDALLEAVGPAGTVLVPTYTYSIGKGEIFDPAATPSTLGDFTEHVRQHPAALRSADPMLAVSGIGPEAADLLENLPRTCYGPGSLYERLEQRGAKLVMIGLGLFWATYRHYIEEKAGVPFRFKKRFTGVVRADGREGKQTWIYSCQIRQPNCAPDGVALEKMAREQGICVSAKIGRGEVCVTHCADYMRLGMAELAENPWLSAKGPPLTLDELIALEDARAGASPAALRSGFFSEGDLGAALSALSGQAPVGDLVTGMQFGDFIVPEKWTCLEAVIRARDGREMLSCRNDPRHVIPCSQPFEGEVSREELLRHLHVCERLEDGAPTAFLPTERDWGFACTREQLAAFQEESWQVIIRATAGFGRVSVGAPAKARE